MEAEVFRARLAHLRSDGYENDSRWCAESIRLAIDAGDQGNMAVGAVVVGPGEKSYAVGMNRLFVPYFRSGLHAEMDALDRFEELPESETPKGEYRLYTSVEPCPMCLTRILFSGIRIVRYAAGDDQGGMATRASQLPPVFASWAADCDIAAARIDVELAQLAADVLGESRSTSRERLDLRWRRLRP